MTEVLNAHMERAADIADVETAIQNQELHLAELRLQSPSGDAAEELAYELFQEERHLNELKAQLEELRAAPIVEIRRVRSLSGPAKGLAVVVGHSARGMDPGALGTAFPPEVQGEKRYEVHWNEELAQMIAADARNRGMPCEIFRRESQGGAGVANAYRAVANWGPRATVELHFNSFDGSGHGTETLYAFDACQNWAQKLQDLILTVYRPIAQARGIVRPKGPWQDRRIKKIGPGKRGYSSVSKLDPATDGPTALIEPFFGDNKVDAVIGQEAKGALASAIVNAFAEFAGLAAGPPIAQAPSTPAGTGTSPGGSSTSAAASLANKPDYFSTEFFQLLHAYAGMAVEFPHLRDISFAQWALETGYGSKSELARQHLNFGGMKYRPEMATLATPVPYTDWQGKTEDYCKFATYEDFIKAYWKRLDIVQSYQGWRRHTGSADEFIGFLGPIWAPKSDGNQNYVEKVRDVCKRIGAKGHLPSMFAAQETVGTVAGNIIGQPPATSTPASQPLPATSEHSNVNSGPIATPAGPVDTAGTTTSTMPVPTASTLAAPAVPDFPAAPPADSCVSKPVVDVTQLNALKSEVEHVVSSARSTTKASGGDLAIANAVDTFIVAGNTLATSLDATITAHSRSKPLGQLVGAVASGADPLFVNAAQLLDQAPIEPYDIKLAMLAQWALESNWGRSDLARVHYNFAGIEWDAAESELSGRVSHKNDLEYCRFQSLERFVETYFKRLDGPQFEDCKRASNAKEFLDRVAPSWRPSDPQYHAKISNIVKRLKTGQAVPLPPVPPITPNAPAPTSTTPASITPASGETSAPPVTMTTSTVPATPMNTSPDLSQGFVFRVKRSHVETRSSGTHTHRTVGTYSAICNGQPVPGLEGAIFEQKGPGDNTLSGRSHARRIEAGTYPLLTQAGQNYVTHGYRAKADSIVYTKPGILVGNTGQRIAILLHPGVGFLSSVGCLNLSKSLPTNGPMIWSDSFSRTIALMNCMRERLGSGFPAQNGKRINNGWLIVEGEPIASRSLLEARARGVSGHAEVARQISDEMIQRLRPKELFEFLSDSINGEVLPGLVDSKLFERALRIGGYMTGMPWLGRVFGGLKLLRELRGPRGETLWMAWVQGWQASTRITDIKEREHVQAELEKVAKQMLSLGLDVNLPGLFQTPLTAAASADAAEAVLKLISMGAKIDAHDPSGNTPLISAAFHGAKKVVGVLLGNRVEVLRRSLGAEQSQLRRSIDGQVETAVEEEIFAETPPRDATALEAALAGQRMLGETDDLTATPGAEPSLAQSYREVVEMLEGRAHAR